MDELLQKIQYHGDQQAFEQLYQLLFFKLYQFAYAYVHSKENAEEIVNDVFMGLWQKRNTLNTIANIHVYLYVAVKNTSLNYIRKNKLPPPVSLDELEVRHLHFHADPENTFITREMQSRIERAIELLPPRCKIIFKLIKEDGFSYKETASILDISVKTVDTQLYLALKKLNVTLLPVWEEYADIHKTTPGDTDH